MKKRILALALAATTAFSMFGASLSVSAIDAWNVGDVPTPKTLTVTYNDAMADSDPVAIFEYGGKEIEVSDFVLATNYDDAIEYEVTKDVPFLYNYVDDDVVSWGSVETAYENGDDIALAKALGVKAGETKEIALKNAAGTYWTFRTALEKKFAAFLKGAQTVVESDDVKDDYNLNVLVAAAQAAGKDLANTASSVLVYFMQAYEVYAEYSELPTIDDAVAAAQAKIDALADRTEEDFKVAKDYKYFVADLDALQDDLDAAKTTADVAAVDTNINVLATKYPASGADKTDLKELLLSLFEGKTINQVKAIATYPTDGSNGAIFDGADYGVKTDAWKAFAAAYEEAVKAYKLVASKSYPTDIAKITDALSDAIDGLSVSNAAPNWMLVKIEEGLAAVSALDSADYSKANWATIEAAIAKAEAVLNADKPGYSAAIAADNALTAALALKPAAPTTSEKKALASAITAGQKALKGLDKTADGAQYYALTIALNNANALYKDGVLKDTVKKSDVANAIDAINDAIDFSSIVLGWNKLADGSYMYGTEDGYVTSAWKWIGSSWYYFDAKGIMVTGWQQLDGAWYYFYTWGGMAKGWAQVNGTWYYLNPNGGKMLSNGWNWIDGKCYYFYSWGGMAANTTIDGYKVDATGAWVK